ncbi:MAG: YkvA family protein [Chloroflexi bacterium]|nr:YkvA family protein [Chloroflexota bacterium]
MRLSRPPKLIRYYNGVMRFISIIIQQLGTVVYLMFHRAVPLRLKALPVLALAYVLMPRDLVPDYFSIAGFVDDALVVYLLLALFISRGKRHLLLAGERYEPKGKTITTSYRIEDDKDKDKDDKEDAA